MRKRNGKWFLDLFNQKECLSLDVYIIPSIMIHIDRRSDDWWVHLSWLNFGMMFGKIQIQ